MKRTKRTKGIIFTLVAVLLAFSAATAMADAATDLLNSGIAYFENKDYDKAIADFTAALKLNKKYAEALCKRGRAYIGKLDYDKAIADFTAALKINKNYAEAMLYRGNAYGLKDDYDKGIAEYTAALKIKPDYADALFRRGVVYYYIKKNYDKAVADFTAALKIEPDRADALYCRGEVYYIKKDYDKAVADFTAALAIKPDYADALLNRGEVYYIKKDYDKAVADFEAALRINPNLAKAKDNLKTAQAKVQAEGANRYDPSKFTMVPSGFKPADYSSVDLFKAVANSKNLHMVPNKQEAISGQMASAFVLGLGGSFILTHKSDLTFVRQNGTDITFTSNDKAITQDMTIDQRSGLQAGQRVRVYYTIMRAPLTTWDVIAIERL